MTEIAARMTYERKNGNEMAIKGNLSQKKPCI